MRSAERAACSGEAAASMTFRSTARSIVSGELTPTIRPANPALRKASANEPPIRPTPKIATVSISAKARYRQASDGAAHSLRNNAELLHHFSELLGAQRLRAVAQGVIGVMVDFDDEPVCPRRHRRARHRQDLVSSAGAVRRIGNDRKMRERLYDWNRGNVHCITGGVLEGADAALAQDHIVIAAGKNIFSAQQQLFDGGGNAALEQNRLANLSEFAQQIVVLHVARAHLQKIGVFGEHRNLRLVHHFAHHQKPVPVSGIAHQTKALFAQALEAIGRGSRLERPAPDDLGPVLGDDFRNLLNLVAIFDAAGSGHDDYSIGADLDVPHFYGRPAGLEMAAGEFIGRDDAVAFLHALHDFELNRIDVAHWPYTTQNSVHNAGGTVDDKAH